MWLLEIHKWDNIESLETDLRIFENGRQKQRHCISVKKGCQQKNKNENKIRIKQEKERMSYLINGAGPIVYPYEKNIMASLLHTIQKNQFLWTNYLNMKNKIYRKYSA